MLHGHYLTSVDQLRECADIDIQELDKVIECFEFRANKYYLSLIDWDDPHDPIRRIVVPDPREMEEWGRLDPSRERDYTVMPGLQHKYRPTVLLLASNVCDSLCRYCFRKRIFQPTSGESVLDIPKAIQYIRSHPEVTNVLLSGGDPLALPTGRLHDIVRRIRQIEHVQIIRIGTRMVACNPYRVTEDGDLLDMIRQFSTETKRIYVITHFIHPRELTEIATRAIALLHEAGAVTSNQAPLIRGVNDRPEVLAELLSRLSEIGNVPYYVFQCRPTIGNRRYVVPIEEGYEIIEQAKARVCGLAKRVRYMMSHQTGKLEIIAKIGRHVHFKYHSAAEEDNAGRILTVTSRPSACWLDDYDEINP